MNWVDLPPVWLVGFILAAKGIDLIFPGASVEFAGAGTIAILLGIGGLSLLVAAALEMLRARTTLIPRREAAALVTSGVFSRSRNPIYLGDAMVLLGFIVWWGAVLALPLVPVFIWLISTRFIKGEEAGLRAGFGDEFEEWAKKTRRWL